MATPKWECGTEQLTGTLNTDNQVLARRYADGFVLVQIVQFHQGRVIAYFHREVEAMRDFEAPDMRKFPVKTNGHAAAPVVTPVPAHMKRKM